MWMLSCLDAECKAFKVTSVSISVTSIKEIIYTCEDGKSSPGGSMRPPG